MSSCRAMNANEKLRAENARLRECVEKADAFFELDETVEDYFEEAQLAATDNYFAARAALDGKEGA